VTVPDLTPEDVRAIARILLSIKERIAAKEAECAPPNDPPRRDEDAASATRRP
jgi:hypothetical protein